VPADIGVATTGVAGPDPQDGHEPGTVFIAVAIAGDVRVTALQFDGDRAAIRQATVEAAVSAVLQRLG
jgi:nicotinamide-nucleotide amidase